MLKKTFVNSFVTVFKINIRRDAYNYHCLILRHQQSRSRLYLSLLDSTWLKPDYLYAICAQVQYIHNDTIIDTERGRVRQGIYAWPLQTPHTTSIVYTTIHSGLLASVCHAGRVGSGDDTRLWATVCSAALRLWWKWFQFWDTWQANGDRC